MLKIFATTLVAFVFIGCNNYNTNNAPIANAGEDQNVNVLSVVALDGSLSSDLDKSDTLTYHWNIISVPSDSNVSVLSKSNTIRPTFTADVDGQYVFKLIVNDGNTDSAESIITVTAFRTLNVAFIGGSITRGAGASNYVYSWASLISSWLKNYYKQEIKLKNIAISATNSEYGTYRLSRDLDGFVPDVAFIEYVVNDPVDKNFIYTYIDALILKLRVINPKVNIIYVATTDQSHKSARLHENEPNGVRFAREISNFNHIHFIDVGKELWNKVFTEAVNYINYLPDGVHPNDKGHKIYFETLKKDLKLYLVNSNGYLNINHNTSSSYLDGSGYKTTTINPVNNILDTNCSINNNYLECSVGKAFKYNFYGSMIGFELKIASDGGQLYCTLDNRHSTNIDFWDTSALSFDRPSTKILFHDLKITSHSLECSVKDVILSNTKGRSTGKTTYISGLIVNDSQSTP